MDLRAEKVKLRQASCDIAFTVRPAVIVTNEGPEASGTTMTCSTASPATVYSAGAVGQLLPVIASRWTATARIMFFMRTFSLSYETD